MVKLQYHTIISTFIGSYLLEKTVTQNSSPLLFPSPFCRTTPMGYVKEHLSYISLS